MQEVFRAIEKAVVRIQEAISYDDTGYANNKNSSGDVQLKLDIKSDYIVEEELSKVPTIKALASEEKKQVDMVNENGTYLVGYDPLDGSSLVDVNLAVGSIFGIYIDEFAGQNLIASAYAVYGPRVELVTIYEQEVHLHRLGRDNKFQFIQKLHLKRKGKLNAPGGTQMNWLAKHKYMVDGFFMEGYRLRYSGAMVPDLHQILIKGGGLFSYPSTSDMPNGKLRQIFEVFPFALAFEYAGGEAITDTGKRILELKPHHTHETTPCFFGSKSEIAKVKKSYGH
ncbi:MAG: class 1 fructose-bisphosphatase [Helicobacteraceae bacterium]